MHFRKNDFRNEKITLDKGTKRATNSIFVVWQNGRVWKRNPEWVNSRLQKLLTKNITMLYFGLPMSSDYTSLLSAGVPRDSLVTWLQGQEGKLLTVPHMKGQ